MMYRKAALFSDTEAAHRLLEAPDSGEAKSIGRDVRGFDQAKWEENRYQIVVEGNLEKFRYHPDLGEFLVNTDLVNSTIVKTPHPAPHLASRQIFYTQTHKTHPSCQFMHT